MLVFSALTLESFASRVVANNAACVAGDARPSGPACFLPERRLAGLVVGDPTVKNPTFRTRPFVISIDRERSVKVIALCYGRPPTDGLYATTTTVM